MLQPTAVPLYAVEDMTRDAPDSALSLAHRIRGGGDAEPEEGEAGSGSDGEDGEVEVKSGGGMPKCCMCLVALICCYRPVRCVSARDVGANGTPRWAAVFFDGVWLNISATCGDISDL